MKAVTNFTIYAKAKENFIQFGYSRKLNYSCRKNESEIM